MLFALVLAALANPPVQANDGEWLVQVRPGARRYFYAESRAGCPAVTARCRRAAYVVPGDQLIATGSQGAFTSVIFVNRAGTESTGLIETAGLARIPLPVPTAASWVGAWKRTEASIDIAPARRSGWYTVSGSATWGAWDPDRVARGAVNIGEFEGEIALANGRITAFGGQVVRALPAADSGDFDCMVTLRLFGPYLMVADNYQCGGVNVRFDGVYRK